jgi:hypothetical protein
MILCSCHQLSKEEKIKKAEQQALDKAREIAAPMIADKVGSLNLLLATANDETLSRQDRGRAINEIRAEFVEYLTAIDFDNMHTDEMQQRISLEKSYIEKKCLAEAAQIVYKQALQKEYEEKK